MYTPAEISTIRALFEKLVAEKRISIELDAYGDPVQQYSRDAMNDLSFEITKLESFPSKDVVENAVREACLEHWVEIFSGFMNGVDRIQMKSRFFATVFRLIDEAAFLEISESLFTQKEIKDMLRQHPDYLDMVQRDIREGKLLADELDDSKQRCADMNAAPKPKEAA